MAISWPHNPTKPRQVPHPDQGRVIRESRGALGISLQDLADAWRCSRRYVKYLQANQRCASGRMAARFRELFGRELPLPPSPRAARRAAHAAEQAALEAQRLELQRKLSRGNREPLPRGTVTYRNLGAWSAGAVEAEAFRRRQELERPAHRGWSSNVSLGGWRR